jgi:hypothetical protein
MRAFSRKARVIGSVAGTVALAATAAGCAGLFGDDVEPVGHAIIAVHDHKIVVSEIVKLTARPQDFHLTIELEKQGLFGYQFVARKLFNITDLPPVGVEKALTARFTCSKGTFTTKWTVSGITSNGRYIKPTSYYYPGVDKYGLPKGQRIRHC